MIFARRDLYESNAIAGGEQRLFVARDVEDLEWGSPDEIPPAGRFHGIDTGLLPADADGSCGNGRARRRAPRRRNAIRQSAEVGEAGHESDHVDEVVAFGVNANDVWALGDHTTFHWNGSSWTTQIGVGGTFRSAWGTDASHIWAAGTNSPVYKWDGTKWSAEQTDAEYELNGVWGTDADHVWLVGQGGAIVGRP